MKKIKKLLRIFFITICISFASLILLCAFYYHITTHGVALDTTKLNQSITNFKIYDKYKNEITNGNNAYAKITDLSINTKNSFICAEDKRFYNHKGIDYIRIGGAIISNVKSKSFSEGASTISQQLIKNTMLSNEKTINRKLKEFKLARSLEKKYTKDEILEMYLNHIYFGNGIYGIENASRYYFGKSATDLTLSESSILAGTINAPTIYNIQKNTAKATERRNLILNLMYSQNKISKKSLDLALKEPINLKISKSSNSNIYNEIIQEASKITNMTEEKLINSNLEIYTNYDPLLLNEINLNINENFQDIRDYEIANIIIDNKTNSIIAINDKSNCITKKLQPGSTIKPILVYAPAIENNIISPATKLLDNKINIAGYSPNNADNKFHGYVSVRDCLKYSYNIPAVKLLNEIGINNAQTFAKQLNITFNDNDNNLAIALGGFTEGITLKQIVDAYSAFANQGFFTESTYITKININNKTIFNKEDKKTKTMSDTTAYLITDMLMDTSETGTAQKIGKMHYEVASKTGTVGKPNSSYNTDAFCVSYTTNHTIITYIGGNKMPSNINGSTYPTLINKGILKTLYKNKIPENFEKPKNLKIQKIDKNEYNKNSIKINVDNKNYIEEIFSVNTKIENNDNVPHQQLTIKNLENRKPILTFYASKNYNYNIYRKEKNKEELISSLSNLNYSKNINFEDISAKTGHIYEYFIEICEKSNQIKYYSNKIKLKSF